MAELLNTFLYNDANLTNYYRFEGNANDSKGANNGTATNISWSSSYGMYGQGASFNGSSSKIVLGSTIDTITQNNSMLCWIYPTDGVDRRDIFSNAAPSDLWGFTFGVDYTIQLFTVNTWGSNGKYYSFNPSTFTEQANRWYLVGYCYDLGNDKTKFFIYSLTDNKLEISSYISPTVWGAGTKATTKPKDFGTQAISAYWKGYIDDAAFFPGKLLSDSEINSFVFGMIPNKIKSINQSIHRSNYY